MNQLTTAPAAAQGLEPLRCAQAAPGPTSPRPPAPDPLPAQSSPGGLSQGPFQAIQEVLPMSLPTRREAYGPP